MSHEKILLFGGTHEGRKLSRFLQNYGLDFAVSVATEYGGEQMEGLEGSPVYVNRLNRAEMRDFIREQGFTLVIDATHPYAKEVTENIEAACGDLNIKRVRLVREETYPNHVHEVRDIREAVAYLQNTEGNILAATGSKELALFTALPHYQERVFARVLPLLESVQACLDIGLSGRHMICMQGPFTEEMNLAMLKQLNCRYLVTKNTGDPGGLGEKLSAAEKAGVETVLIHRPLLEEGYSYEETIRFLTDHVIRKKHGYFPLFIPLKDRNILVVGGGRIATRRVETLSRFDCYLTVIAPECSERLATMESQGRIQMIRRIFQESDLEGVFWVIAATNDREVNRSLGHLAGGRGIYATISDQKEESNCYFPGVVESGSLVAGITSGGEDHGLVAAAAKKIREVLEFA